MMKTLWKGISTLGLTILALFLGACTASEQPQPDHVSFSRAALPIDHIDRFFDVGVVDANDDGNLDIYTSNHHFRQVLLLSDGQGGYRDVLSEWGLDQSRAFPRAELSFASPTVDAPGLYIFWVGTQFVIQYVPGPGMGPVYGSLSVNDPIRVLKNRGFKIENHAKKLNEIVTQTRLDFATDQPAYLRLAPGGQGLPIRFQLSDGIRADRIYVGLGKASPVSTDFVLASRDRHALAWADYDQDGHKDIFINRGALGGTLRAQPDEIRAQLQDELLVRGPDGRYHDIARLAGLDKRDCSGRHAHWLDFNSDGRLDLFVNCFNRGHVAGDYPKQLYIRRADGRLVDRAVETGAALPEAQMGSLAWFDVDGDNDPDLVTLENQGLFLYRNQQGRLAREEVFHRPLSGVQIGSTTKGEWVYDGKISLADFDLDGDLDVFSSSKRGNVVLVNDQGHLHPVAPATLGLPDNSLNATWLDADNDGRPDLFTVPQGLYHNDGKGFSASGAFRYPEDRFVGAVSNAWDMDNDGRMDLLLAFDVNPDYQPRTPEERKPRHSTTWLLEAWHNDAAPGHWLEMVLRGPAGNHQAIGARVKVTTAAGVQLQEVGSSEGAFFSQGHYRLHFGLGEAGRAERLEVIWPDGSREIRDQVPADRVLTLSQNQPRHSGTPSP